MKKIIYLALIIGILVLNIGLALAIENHQSEIEEGRKLIENNISCDKLTDEQLEAIGEYYMEQMHPGEAHEFMDNMMGGEGSESLKQVHITITKKLYCNEDISGMMDGGMMQMMGGYYGGFGGVWIFGFLFMILGSIALILFIVWLIKQLQKDNIKKR